jgi:hypothetical protein
MKTAQPRAFAHAFAFSLLGFARQHRVPCALRHTHFPNGSLLHHNVGVVRQPQAVRTNDLLCRKTG